MVFGVLFGFRRSDFRSSDHFPPFIRRFPDVFSFNCLANMFLTVCKLTCTSLIFLVSEQEISYEGVLYFAKIFMQKDIANTFWNLI